MKKIMVMILTLFIAFNSYAQSRGMKEVAETNLGTRVTVGKQYALFIAIDNYREWTPLKKPVADAKEIRDILQKDYFIDEVIELYNEQATRQNIIKTFTDLQAKIGVHDSLFIYYAGHGYLEDGSGQGFWIPVDGGADKTKQDNWLLNSQIRGYISRFKTIHVFLVSDSCFSGDLLDASRSSAPQIDNEYLRKAYTLMSRQVMTSGASEQVPDQSEFSAAFINTLRKNTDPLLCPSDIFPDLRRSVRKTMPMFGPLAETRHQSGAEFIFFRRQTSVTVQPSPTPTPQPSTVPTNMVLINGGTFTMGSPRTEANRDRDETQHQVTVSSFYMSPKEVTLSEYLKVMQFNPNGLVQGANMPVISINWYNAIEYCNARSIAEGLTPAYNINYSRKDPNNRNDNDYYQFLVTWDKNADGYRLPTEAEWEYACRAGTNTAYNNGNSITDSQAVYRSGTAFPVGSYTPNKFGLYDMHGNVAEWCWDWYGEYNTSAQTDPSGPVSGKLRVARGGSWRNSKSQHLRSAYRLSLTPTWYGNNMGIRVVRSIKQEQQSHVALNYPNYSQINAERRSSNTWWQFAFGHEKLMKESIETLKKAGIDTSTVNIKEYINYRSDKSQYITYRAFIRENLSGTMEILLHQAGFNGAWKRN